MRFSVVVPCYNEADSIAALVERCSVVAEVRDGEFILVDNGSTDGTGETIGAAITSEPRISMITVSENQGYGHGIIQGLCHSRAPIVGWTHADFQTDPADLVHALGFFDLEDRGLFVKGFRVGRPVLDRFFTAGMSAVSSILLGRMMSDINAQPTLFSRGLLDVLVDPPRDYSLDLFAYHQALLNGFHIKRFPVVFPERKVGFSKWNTGFSARMLLARQTLAYILELR